VRQLFRQRMQAKIDISESEYRQDQENACHDHQDIGLAGFGDVERQVMGRQWMKLIGQCWYSQRTKPQ
jgi:hypothetical protein